VIQDVRETRAIGDHLKCPHFRRKERLRSLSVFDVRCGRIPAEYRPLFIQHGLIAKQKPAIPPIFAEQAFLDLKRRSLCEADLTLAPNPLEIVRVDVSLHTLSGSRALHLFQRASVEIEQRLVRVNESSLGVQDDHVLRKEVDELSKFPIGVLERRLRSVALAVRTC
jgi:hypothetical protein